MKRALKLRTIGRSTRTMRAFFSLRGEPSSIVTRMRAIVLKGFGDVDVMELREGPIRRRRAAKCGFACARPASIARI